ncbi:MAG: hypothetical protein IJZ49_06835 [Alistipes sp.]|nr:hypothetical protein [Alistipes sp.]
MNIEKIKSEFERLSQIISSWSDNEPIAAIERDLALDKLLKIYDMVRFAENNSENDTPIATPAVTKEQVATPESPLQDDEELNDVEVEFIFADEQEEQEDFDVIEPTTPEPTASPEQESKQEGQEEQKGQEEQSDKPAQKEQTLGEILAATVAATVASEQTEPAQEQPSPAAMPKEKPAAAPIPTPQVEPQVEPTPIKEIEPIATEKSEPQTPAKAEAKAARPMSSLFGVEEPSRKPRTKHQRMMSIYNDTESRPEKVVDISKIFDLDIDEPAATPQKSEEPSTPKAAPIIKEQAPAIADAEPATTLGDVISHTSQTLADTIAAPTALGEEISHKNIKSLRQGIGLNDKFLMIRDLFDGNADEYEQAIDALDGFDDFDDCIIYIAENFAWNADSEGAKFIMQLLERKLS